MAWNGHKFKEYNKVLYIFYIYICVYFRLSGLVGVMHQKIPSYQRCCIRITLCSLVLLRKLCGLLETKLLPTLLLKLQMSPLCLGLDQVCLNCIVFIICLYLRIVLIHDFYSIFLDLTAPFSGKKVKISTELYRKGCVQTPEEGAAAAQKIGYPIMIKASEGGGGKGIRKVESHDEFAVAFRQVNFKLVLIVEMFAPQKAVLFMFSIFF